MNAPSATPHTFYAARVPEQFNRTLAEQERAAAEGDEDSQRRLSGMKTVDATIGVVVMGEEKGEAEAKHAGEKEFRHYLNIESGRMTAGEEARKPPFMTLFHDLDSLANLERASGDSLLGFLGAIAGMPGDMALTSQRIQNLHGLDGALRFELTGADGFCITARFGQGKDQDDDPNTGDVLASKVRCSISLDAATYDELRGGTLAPQDAFMSGRVQVDGDMQMVMKIALAALSPE